jgi:hypothetical protein
MGLKSGDGVQYNDMCVCVCVSLSFCAGLLTRMLDVGLEQQVCTMVRNAVILEAIAAHRIAGASRRPAGMALCRSLRRLSSARAPLKHARIGRGASAATAATLRGGRQVCLAVSKRTDD